MHAFLSNLANRQTDRQTDKRGQTHLPPLLSEVIIRVMKVICGVRNTLSQKWCRRNFLFLSRVSIPTRDIDIAILSVCPSGCLSVRDVPVSDENGLTYRHSFLPYGSPIILVLPASNIFTKFRRGHPLRGR